MCGLAYFIMVQTLLANHAKDSVLASALKDVKKERWSLVLYGAAIPLAFVGAWISMVLYVVVAIMWLMPDPRIEEKVGT